MPFILAFTVTQGADCSQFAVNDTSDYSVETTSTFTARRLSIQKSDGTFLVVGTTTYQNYLWPFASGNTINFTGLGSDLSFVITLTNTPVAAQPGSVYTKTSVAPLVCYTMSGFYTFAYKMAINPSLEKDYKFVKDVMRLWIEQESAKKSAIDGDNPAAQSCLDRAKYIIDNLTIGY